MTTAVARRGRPRSEAIDAAILEAAVDELVDRGFVALSMEGVAARAGVAKTTLYRRWDNITDLAVEAMRTFDAGLEDPPQGADLREQLRWLLETMRRKWNNPRFAAIMRRASADGSVQPEMYREARDRLIAPYIRRMNDTLRSAALAGEIRGDLDVSWVRQMLVAPILAAALTHKGRISSAQVDATVDVVLRGLAP